MSYPLVTEIGFEDGNIYEISDKQSREKIETLEGNVTDLFNKVMVKYENPYYIPVTNQAEFNSALELLNNGREDIRIEFRNAGNYYITKRVINYTNIHMRTTAIGNVVINWVSPNINEAPAFYGGKLNITGTLVSEIVFNFLAGGSDFNANSYYGTIENTILDLDYCTFNTPVTFYNSNVHCTNCTFIPHKVGTSNSHSITAGVYFVASKAQLDGSATRYITFNISDAPADMKSTVRASQGSELICNTEYFTYVKSTSSPQVPWYGVEYSDAIINIALDTVPSGIDANNLYIQGSFADVRTTQAQYNVMSNYISVSHSSLKLD